MNISTRVEETFSARGFLFLDACADTLPDRHDNNDIYEKAMRILETYFGVDEEDVNIAPEAVGNAFAFGQVQNTPQKPFDFGQPGM